MLAILVLAAALSAAPPKGPVAPRSSPATVLVRSPKTGLAELRAFLTEAGQYSATLRPLELGRSLGAMLGADLLDPAALQEAGVDVEAPVSVSLMREATVVCFTAAKGGKAVERARATLAGSGQPAKLAHKGSQIEGAVSGKAWRAGLVAKGAAACVASGGTDALSALKEAVDALGGSGLVATPAVKAAAGLDAPVLGYFQAGTSGGAFEIRASKAGLKIVGRGSLKQMPLDKPKEGDALAGFSADAPVVLRAQVTPRSLAEPGGLGTAAVAFLLSNACKACDASVTKGLLDALKPELTGSVGVVLRGLEPSAAPLKPAMYWLFPHAYVLPLKDAAKAQKALEAAIGKIEAKGARFSKQEVPEGAEWFVAVGGKDARVGIAKGALYVGNDANARDLALGAVTAERPDKAPAHALSFVLNGPLATGELRRISILDIPKAPELAALFAFGVELGSLLRAAGPISGFADPDGAYVAFELGLNLQATAPAGPDLAK